MIKINLEIIVIHYYKNTKNYLIPKYNRNMIFLMKNKNYRIIWNKLKKKQVSKLLNNGFFLKI